ncbi:MAG: hypothetical protein ACLUD0_06805 [Eubacterium ramulus]
MEARLEGDSNLVEEINYVLPSKVYFSENRSRLEPFERFQIMK